MACAAPSNLCATCLTLPTEQKQKPGILLCIGCQKHFCSQHSVEHRQHLTDLFENEVANERNMLHEENVSTLYEHQWSANIKLQLEIINKWESDTTELIRQSAERARQQIHEMSLKEYDNLKKQFATVSDELITLRENENYFENDIEQLINRLTQLKHGIEQFPIEVNINEIPQELIIVKSIVQTAPPSVPSFYFVDQLLKSRKPKASFNVSIIKTGRMCPMNDQLVAFYSKNALPTLNIGNGSWKSLCSTDNATELHWSDYLQQFLVFKYRERINQPNKLYLFDPTRGSCVEIFQKPPAWKSG